jgi:hypothetical protein
MIEPEFSAPAQLRVKLRMFEPLSGALQPGKCCCGEGDVLAQLVLQDFEFNCSHEAQDRVISLLLSQAYLSRRH